MTRVLSALAFLAALTLAGPARAGLAVGAAAPDFTTEAALAGKAFRFALADALKQGAVVIFFYPKSFTSVCTEEANLFAEASGDFAKLGAQVLGVSADSIDTQREFSSKECRDKFAVAADPDGKIIRAYDVKMPVITMARRISYVVAPDGRILSVTDASGAEKHVTNALAALKAFRGK
jgi:peroxiredoxin Q/BCP